MICPVCEGICGKVKHYVDKYSSFMYMESCQHCDGQGEIQDGDVWRCDLDEVGNHHYTTGNKVIAYLIYRDNKWKSGQNIYGREMVVPICRMKEVG